MITNNETPLTDAAKAAYEKHTETARKEFDQILSDDKRLKNFIADTPPNGWQAAVIIERQLNAANAENARLKTELAAEVEAHAKSAQQHVDYVAGKITLEDIQVQNGALNIETSTEMVRVMASHFELLLDQHGATNYLEMGFKKAGSVEPILVTIKRHDGKTPHQLRVEAEQKLAKYRDVAASLAWNLASGQIKGSLSDTQRNAIKKWETLQSEL